jgi:large subunit ribosomal protein L21
MLAPLEHTMIRRVATRTMQTRLKTTGFPYCSVRSSQLDCRAYNQYQRSNSRIVQLMTVEPRFTQKEQSIFYFSTSSSLDDYDDGNDDDDDIPPPSGPVSNPKFAVVNHAIAYQKAMDGLHGQQLATAQLEGEGKDEPDFDPFLEEELEEARLLYEEEQRLKRENEVQSTDQQSKNIDATEKNNENENDKENLETQQDEEDEEEEEEIDISSPQYQHKLFRKKYNNDGSLKRNKSEMAMLRAGAPAGGRIAIIALAGTQYKVTSDDVLITNLLQPVKKYAVGTIQTLTNEQVLLVSSSAMTLVGMPYVPGAEVDVLVEEITRDTKVIIYKKRRRKNSQRKTGFRRDVTMLRVLDIRFPEKYDDHEHTIRPEPAPLVPKGVRKIV